MTNKLKYFIGNWKMYGDLSSFSIFESIDSYLKKNTKINISRNKIIILCAHHVNLSIFFET